MDAGWGRVDTAIASAGTGKTTRIVGLIAEAIECGLEPERVLGTTFTVKAADELLEKARSHLVATGHLDEATRLLSARMGTVNSVCGRLVSDFALDLGRSPSTEVIPEDAQAAMFAIAADRVLGKYAGCMHGFSDAFGMTENKDDWRGYVRCIIELARSNGINPTSFALSAERSLSGFCSLLPPPHAGETADSLDQALRRAIGEALQAIEGVDLKKGSAKAVDALTAAAATFRRGENLSWPMWARLSKPNTPKADTDYFASVAAAASCHPRHPRLRQDIENFTRAVFACAAEALTAYQEFKTERGLLDFIDQETLALEVLQSSATAERLRERIGAVFVDEVQDSSPLQIALFTELARLVPTSVWVGDPKQSIYGFRGTDSNLTLAASRHVAEMTGGTTEVLAKSWRSRPGIVAFVNDAFVPAFVRSGLPEVDCRFADCACDDTGFSVPPLNLWRVQGSNKASRALALAQGIKAALANPSDWAVRDGPELRAIRSGDVAVLCRSGLEVERVASALAKEGIRVAVERNGLSACPEVEIATAALKWTADRTNRLALAEVARLLGGVDQPDAWLRAVLDTDPDAALKKLVPFTSALEQLREEQLQLTPAEVLDGIIIAAGVLDVACRWGAAADRIDGLEAVRGLARNYEETCRRLRAPATVGGLAVWLDEQDGKRPKSLDPDAVQVMTYHKAKGLEWPLVVLTQLEDEVKCDLFKPTVQVDGTLEWRDPLAGRWIRFWPWPYGPQDQDVHLDAAAPNSDVGAQMMKKAREEAVRLLYVGVTRARDHVVFVQPNACRLAWIDQLSPDAGMSHIELPEPESGNELHVGCQGHRARVQVLSAADETQDQGTERVFVCLERNAPELRPLRLRPSMAGSGHGIEYRITDRVDLGGRIPISGNPDMAVLGEAVHSILAADDPDAPRADREAKAERVLQRWSVPAIDPRDAIVCADRLWRFLAERFSGARVRREVPVHAVLGTQAVNGRIDLTVEGEDWFAIVDHKSFPGAPHLWDAKVLGYAPQLALYSRAAGVATDKACHGHFVHMPLVGVVCEVGALELVP